MIDLPKRLDDAGLAKAVTGRETRVFGRGEAVDGVPMLAPLPRVLSLADVVGRMC